MILENIKVFLRKIIPTCSIQIRSACMEDTDFIYQCINYGRSEKHFHGKIFSIDEIKRSPYFYILLHNNTKAGFAYCGPNKDKHFEINMLYVLKDFRKKGISKFFINAYEKNIIQIQQIQKEFINNKSCLNYMIARCDIENSKPAINLFKKLGFKQVGEEVGKNYKFAVLKKQF